MERSLLAAFLATTFARARFSSILSRFLRPYAGELPPGDLCAVIAIISIHLRFFVYQILITVVYSADHSVEYTVSNGKLE